MTEKQLLRLQNSWSSIVHEDLKLVEITGKVYANGSELAVRRLAHHLKTFDIGCSAHFALQYTSGWYCGFEPTVY
jgi:hypothetical protein